jgi:hypothetical protein
MRGFANTRCTSENESPRHQFLWLLGRGRGGWGESLDHITVYGTHLTVLGGATRVSNSTDAVQAPVVCRD